ncbi:hypothetical protein [Methanogenium organophilum]|uniref:Uncharacterized protein n=1 Tax=Methanogenium organophilum TaxID=2199 RepID=A0A9X9S5H2_METOG|nr:hypothetical protein [Methanogenium organophilum]WAI01813.1 hypothetical protein OU421_02765 [Methanogenium organophilum]
MSAMSPSEKNEPKSSPYRVILHGRLSDPTQKIRECSAILDHWDVFTENREDRILDEHLSTAMIGSAYTQSSPPLTVRQLFGLWRNGHGIHTRFYDETGEPVPGPLYMVGMGGSVLSGAFVFWGVVPSQELIVVSNISPEPGRCKVPSNSILYAKAAKGE